jgi:hypothetical protein
MTAHQPNITPPVSHTQIIYLRRIILIIRLILNRTFKKSCHIVYFGKQYIHWFYTHYPSTLPPYLRVKSSTSPWLSSLHYTSSLLPYPRSLTFSGLYLSLQY